MEEQRSLVLSPIVELSVPIEQVMEGWQRYLKLCEALLDDNDYQWAEGKKFRKKSAFRKLARAFNVADEVVDRETERDKDGRVVEASLYVRATAPNGRQATGYGSCSIWERSHEEDRVDDKSGNIICKGPCNGRKHFSKPDHTIPATAHTRAKNRAIADLIGAGEVSAEEMALDEDDDGAVETKARPSGGTTRFPFGKHKGKLLADIPTDYLEWAAEKAENEGVRTAVKEELARRANPEPQVVDTKAAPQSATPGEVYGDDPERVPYTPSDEEGEAVEPKKEATAEPQKVVAEGRMSREDAIEQYGVLQNYAEKLGLPRDHNLVEAWRKPPFTQARLNGLRKALKKQAEPEPEDEENA